ncbi:unnamed protein product [Dicrocoelium dendriticum]|nr:unnamed protein product [Dicrocoelium dendriticum]
MSFKDLADTRFSLIPKVVNGGIAGIVGVTCVFPIDLVKTRLQNQQDSIRLYSSFLDCARKTFQREGFLGMYRGEFVLSSASPFVYLVFNRKPLTPLREVLAGAGAGTCQIIVTTPMELLKIQLQDAGRTASVSVKAVEADGLLTSRRLSATQLALQLIRERGIFGLYRGMGATFLRDVSFSMIYFPLFANFNALGPRRSPGSIEAAFYWSFLSGFLAGSIGAFSVTPFDVVKTRIQTINRATGERSFSSITDCFIQTVKDEGLVALFKGGGCRILVMAPLFGIAQSVYYLGVAERLLGYQRI